MPAEPSPPHSGGPALRATYRLQLHAGFGFDQARAVLDYLSELGVSHAYVSPCLTAASGSTHGYDVTDPSRVNEELGGHRARDAFASALRDRGMGQIVDIVPNHMAASAAENPWWRDLLENGIQSRYARHFDVEWPSEGPKVVHLPILAASLEESVSSGAISLAREAGTLVVRVGGQSLPLTPRCVCYLEVAPRAHETLDDLLARYNASPELLLRVLNAQNYVLHEWREGARHRNYRRFFDVDSLVALRAEDDEVFRDSHAVISRWLAESAVAGVRVDHVDGLRDPAGYLERLGAVAPPARIFVEKILNGDEALPDGWRISGTTGYEALNRLERIFVDPDGEAPFTELYARFTGVTESFVEVARDAKHLVMRTSLDSDVRRLVRCLAHECRETRWFEVPDHALRSVITEYLAELPVYRTYVRAGHACSGADVAVVRTTVARVARRLPEIDPAFLDFIASRLVAGEPGKFALLLQQTSGAVMAKGVEDTAFYRYARFVALNEVGGDPSVFGATLPHFHAGNQAVCERWPETLVATATHDTKRGEDVRARLAALPSIPEEWALRVERWRELTSRYRDARLDPNDEYFFYQTLVGAFPLSEARAQQYVRKAIREAKRHTSWTDPDAEYEAAMARFVEGTLHDAACMRDVGEFVSRIAPAGRVISLAKKLVALTMPGVPDLYQGTELWDFSLVDPDNRRQVDYDERRKLLASSAALGAEEIWAAAESGLPKMRVVQGALAVRRRHARSFAPGGTYTPLESAGERRACVVSYARGDDVVVIVPRFVIRLEGRGFGDTTVTLPEGRFTNEFTRDTVEGVARLAPLLQRFPVALLTRTG